jgi:hypothetical protein
VIDATSLRRIILDENVPWQLLRELPGHDATTAAREGWKGVANGELLRRIERGGFEVFITADRNLEHQQRIAGRPFGTIVLAPRRLKLEQLLPLAPALREAVASIRPGETVRIGPSPPR